MFCLTITFLCTLQIMSKFMKIKAKLLTLCPVINVMSLHLNLVNDRGLTLDQRGLQHFPKFLILR